MPPWWKIRRELTRPLKQLITLPANLSTWLWGSWYFDSFKKVQRFDGCSQKKAKAAVFVIFPREGTLLRSHLRSIQFLNRNGYDVTLVSNAPLQQSSINEALPFVTTLIIRPNFGYDFGGYRQGILDLLRNKELRLSHLLLVNDSCWFPASQETDWIQIAEAKDKDLIGLTPKYGLIKKIRPDDQLVWRQDTSSRNFHYCSFALLFSGRLIYDPKFFDFWSKLALTNRKSRVVRRGEIGLTQFALRNGFSYGSTIDVEVLQDHLNALEDQELSEVFDNLLIPWDRELQIEYNSICLEKTHLRRDLIQFIMKSISKQGLEYGLAYFSIKHLQNPFLKKSIFNSGKASQHTLQKITSIIDEDLAWEIAEEVNRGKARKVI